MTASDIIGAYQSITDNYTLGSPENSGMKHRFLDDKAAIAHALLDFSDAMGENLVFRTLNERFTGLDHVIGCTPDLQLLEQRQPYHWDERIDSLPLRGIELVPRELLITLHDNPYLSSMLLFNEPDAQYPEEYRAPEQQPTFYKHQSDEGFCDVLNLDTGYHPVLIIPQGSMLVGDAGTHLIEEQKKLHIFGFAT